MCQLSGNSQEYRGEETRGVAEDAIELAKQS